MENNIFIIATIFVPYAGAALALAVPKDMQKRYLALLASFIAWIFSIVVLIAVNEDGTQIYRLGGWEPPYGIVLVADHLSALFGFMSATIMLGGILYAVQCKDKSITSPSFMALFLTMETGLLGAMYTGDLFTLFVFIELTVVSSVANVAIGDSRFALEAAMKYLFMSSLGSLFLLLGIASIYVTFGTVNFADLARQLAISNGNEPLLTRASAVMLLSAFLLKSSVAPFHWWQPDFHTAAPTPLSAVLSSVIVKIGIYGIIRLTSLLFVAEQALIYRWLVMLGVLAIFFGGLSALRTYNGKRVLAYSTFGQIGFILLGIGWGTPLALLAALVYTFNHAFIKSSLLMLMGVVASRNEEHSADLEKVAGTGRKLHWSIGLLFFLGGMALAGLPPMNGFISKFLLLQSGLEAHEWLATSLAIGGGILTLIYMMKTWQLIFQQKPTETSAIVHATGGDGYLAPALLIAASLLLGIFATPLYKFAEDTVTSLDNPHKNYIEAVEPDNWRALDYQPFLGG
ncbi:MAG: hypothetical protein CUN55_12885 [Phototrophicales bacterium]|nr:MAG: hypothetical protein CUN55_12885 [Phototrophicales bacterium]